MDLADGSADGTGRIACAQGEITRMRAWLWSRTPEYLRNAHDPVVALALWSLAVVGAIAAGLSSCLGYSLADMLPVLGGVVVLLGSYFAARTLRDNELSQATQMLSSDREAVRLAGIYRLGTVAAGVPRFRTYVEIALMGLAEENPGAHSKQYATDVLAELDKLKDRQVHTLSATPGALPSG